MTLPIVERELRVASRQARTYWERLGWGLLSISVVAFIINNYYGRFISQDQQGVNIFFTLSAFAFFYTLMAGVILTSDSVSEEKREGTLGLLFLTNLKGYDVVLGKLAARSLHAVYGVITIFPIMAICFLMGGVKWSEMGRMVLLLMNTLFFSLSLGMLVSTLSQTEMRARITVFLIMVGLNLAIPSIISGFAEDLPSLVTRAFWYFVPHYGWSSGFSGRYDVNSSNFWINQVTIHIMGWTFLAIASGMVTRVWQDKVKGLSIPFKERWKNYRLGTSEEQIAYRTALLGINPITWLVNRNRLAKWFPLIFLSSCLILYGVGFLKWGDEMLEEGVIIMYGMFIHTWFKLWAISDSVRIFSESKKSGALDLIVATPMKVDEIVYGFWNGLVYQFRWSIVCLVLTDLALITFSASNNAEFVFTCFVGVLLLVVDMMTIGWLGMWLSLTRKTVSALVTTIFYILVLPWLIFFVLMISSNQLRLGFTEALLTFMTVSLLLDFLFYQWSSMSLRGEFRNLVAHQFRSPGKKI